jgi:hypothetical protein
MAPTITYTASVYQDQETGKIECTVTQNIHAGICGPAASFEVETADVNAVDIELAQKGYRRAAAWSLVTSYQGMQLTVAVEPAEGRKWGDL